MHQSAKGSVYLEEVSEWSFEANHPTIIDQNTMLKIVKGVIYRRGHLGLEQNAREWQ